MTEPWTLALVAFGLYLAAVAALLVAGRREHARAVAGLIPDCVVMVKRLIADPGTPRRQRLLLVALVGYLASPIDLVPDFVPVAGQLDDAIIVVVALHLLLRGRGEEPMARVGSGDGTWAYTFYARQQSPFVHALNTTQRKAFCIDLPIRLAPDERDRVRLRRAAGKIVVRLGGRTLAAIDTRTLRVTRG